VSKNCHLDAPQVAEKIDNANFQPPSRSLKADKKCTPAAKSTASFFAFAVAFKYIGYIV